MNKIATIIAAENNQDTIRKTLESLSWVDELIVVLSENSCDETENIAKEFTKKVYKTKNHLGLQRNFGIAKSKSSWIFVVDSDELVSRELAQEIKQKIKKIDVRGYFVRYRNYFGRKRIKYGNQNYKKLRLFQKKYGKVENFKTHPEIVVRGKTEILQGYIDHYSFRSLWQTLKKFTYYAQEDKYTSLKNEQPSLWKLCVYPLHMFWTLFFEEKGYKDGVSGFLLAICFSYYEWMRYFFLFFPKLLN